MQGQAVSIQYNISHKDILTRVHITTCSSLSYVNIMLSFQSTTQKMLINNINNYMYV